MSSKYLFLTIAICLQFDYKVKVTDIYRTLYSVTAEYILLKYTQISRIYHTIWKINNLQ